MTPPSSPLGNPDSLPPTLWSLEDPHIPILHSIGFAVKGWYFPKGLPTWEQVHAYKQQHLLGISFYPGEEQVSTTERQHLHSVSLDSDD